MTLNYARPDLSTNAKDTPMLDRHITPSDILYVAEYMRAADRMEVEAASGLTPMEVLTEGVNRSAVSLVYRDLDNVPVFIVGVVEGLDGGVGVIWLLGSDDILLHKRALHRLARRVLTEWHKKWPRLSNIVDARNTVHIRWLKSMGFQFGPPIIAGVAQIPFIPFFRELNV